MSVVYFKSIDNLTPSTYFKVIGEKYYTWIGTEWYKGFYKTWDEYLGKRARVLNRDLVEISNLEILIAHGIEALRE